MSTTQATVETGATVVAKTAPPITVSIATLAGYNVADVLVWATLIYTVILIAHKLYSIAIEVHMRHLHGDRRTGDPDTRADPVERRK